MDILQYPIRFEAEFFVMNLKSTYLTITTDKNQEKCKGLMMKYIKESIIIPDPEDLMNLLKIMNRYKYTQKEKDEIYSAFVVECEAKDKDEDFDYNFYRFTLGNSFFKIDRCIYASTN